MVCHFHKTQYLREPFSMTKDCPPSPSKYRVPSAVYLIWLDSSTSNEWTFQLPKNRLFKHISDEKKKQNDETPSACHSREMNHKSVLHEVSILVFEENQCSERKKEREIVEILKRDCINFENDQKRLESHYEPMFIINPAHVGLIWSARSLLVFFDFLLFLFIFPTFAISPIFSM